MWWLVDDMTWGELALFALAGVTGNVGLMMFSGWLPFPPGAWIDVGTGALVGVSVVCLILLIDRPCMQDAACSSATVSFVHERRGFVADVEDDGVAGGHQRRRSLSPRAAGDAGVCRSVNDNGQVLSPDVPPTARQGAADDVT